MTRKIYKSKNVKKSSNKKKTYTKYKKTHKNINKIRGGGEN